MALNLVPLTAPGRSSEWALRNAFSRGSTTRLPHQGGDNRLRCQVTHSHQDQFFRCGYQQHLGRNDSGTALGAADQPLSWVSGGHCKPGPQIRCQRPVTLHGHAFTCAPSCLSVQGHPPFLTAKPVLETRARRTLGITVHPQHTEEGTWGQGAGAARARWSPGKPLLSHSCHHPVADRAGGSLLPKDAHSGLAHACSLTPPLVPQRWVSTRTSSCPGPTSGHREEQFSGVLSPPRGSDSFCLASPLQTHAVPKH